MEFIPHLSSSRKIQTIFVIALITSLAISIGALVLMRHSMNANEFVLQDELEDTVRIITLKADSEAIESSFRGFLLSEEPEFLTRYQDAETLLLSEISALLNTATSEKERTSLTNLLQSYAKHRLQIEHAIALKKNNIESKEIEPYFLNKIQPMRDKLRAQIEALRIEKEQELQLTKQEVTVNSNRVFWLILSATSLALFLVVITVFLLNRRLSSLYDLSKKSAEELKETVEGLQHVNTNLNEFAAIAAHDLKSPLRTMSMYLQLLNSDIHQQQQLNTEEIMKSILDSSKRMRTLVDDLLTYSSAENMEIKTEPVSLENVVKSVVENLQKDIQDCSAHVEFESLPKLVAEPKSLYALLQNLIANALKYRSEKMPDIKISAEETANNWTISVKDNGIGFDMTKAEDIFRPFKRLSENKHVSGTGLGLAICKKIIERHKGKIWAISQPGKGSTFLFTIPKFVNP